MLEYGFSSLPDGDRPKVEIFLGGFSTCSVPNPGTSSDTRDY